MLTELGKLCGSSFLNDELRKHIRARLTSAWKQLSRALKVGNSTFECGIESAVNVFEHLIKRTFGTSAIMLDERVKIYGVNSDAKRRFDCNGIILSKYDCYFQYPDILGHVRLQLHIVTEMELKSEYEGVVR
ncbi:uncharacterized protein K441DRAFT_349332 [Cenococcum geophilum 1.58]|uniref:Uncharacterized protein n=1 Tax=Cenococcum geophilum 1.58 TaxID=794803 RepID=A0ACC8EMX5_9PEZI|nr:hypothetical protein K441DRAFT_349332 [Cenococcum geophilum 1.58]